MSWGRSLALDLGLTASLTRVWLVALLVGAYSLIPLYLVPTVEAIDVSTVADAVLATALGFLLVFRMNRAYERWWEARTLWGTLVNVSRNLAIKVRELALVSPSDRTELKKLIVGYSYALKSHLRGETSLRSLRGFESSEAEPKHVPSYIVRRIYACYSRWMGEGLVDTEEIWLLDRESRVFIDVCGGCERIKNTLMSQSFPILVRQALFLYLLYLPWSLVKDFGLYAVPIAVIFSYFLVGAEGIATYVERPFGEEDDHLDLDTICQGIELTVGEILDSE